MEQWLIFDEQEWSAHDRYMGREHRLYLTHKKREEDLENLFPWYQLPVWDHVQWEWSRSSLEASLEPEDP